MRKAKGITCLPVLTFDSGKKIATVQGVLPTSDHRRILALLVDEGGWFAEAKVLPFRAIKTVGRDAIVISNEQAIIRISEDSEIKKAFDERKVVTGLRMFTEDGRDLGTIEDVFLDEVTGEAKGFEVAGGFLTTITRGRIFVPMPDRLKVGDEIAYVPPETGVLVEEEVTSGIQRGLEEARRRGEEVLARTVEELEKARDAAMKATAEQQKRFAVGKVADRTVAAPDGTEIVHQGDTISEQMASQAEQKGVLQDLVLAAGTSVARGAMERLREEAARALKEVRRTAGPRAGSKPGQTAGRGASEAVGRRVSRVVLDQNERVILNAGDMVTHESIDRAREAGVLDNLLGAVSWEEPPVILEEHRVRRTHRHEPPKAGER
ncbi:MAG: PRC-barrel domain-containing protein [Chloroflexi bacterium]|nr:PRC-barrel domain-containing protein [Chloroflexota bacterium]